jgi:hypothetical protein
VTAEAITRAEGRGSAVLWAGLLTGPLAWTVQLLADWGLSEVVSCAPAAQEPGTILGLSLNGFVAVLNLMLLAATVGSGLLSLSCLRAIRRRGDDTPGRRAHWMAAAGVMTAALFAIVITASFAPVVLVEGCAR